MRKVWSVKAQSKTGALLGWFHAVPGGRGPWKGVDVRQITVRRRGIRRGWVESEPRHIEPHGGRRPVARILWAALKVPGADEVCVLANCFGNAHGPSLWRPPGPRRAGACSCVIARAGTGAVRPQRALQGPRRA